LEETEAIFGLANVMTFGEIGDAAAWITRLAALRNDSPEQLVRHATAALSHRRFTSGLAQPLAISEVLHALPSVDNPKTRSAYYYTTAYALAQRADYRQADGMLALLTEDVTAFGLEFAQPFVDWTAAFIKLGLRRFGEADRHIQALEDAAPRLHRSQALNAALIRARLLIQTGNAEEAIELLKPEHGQPVYPSWDGELDATRAFALAVTGASADALAAAERAVTKTRCLEVHIIAQAARALTTFDTAARQPVYDLFEMARRFEIWDPVMSALRVSRPLLELAAADEKLRPHLRMLLARAGDAPLARQAGIRSRTPGAPTAVLSSREQEVLGLVAQGLRNREIASALYIAESTVKVHVRHILEKLGVRTRAEAVARFERARAIS
jgi:ATP/maltotriose-dependent transcriptional regulator MalT